MDFIHWEKDVLISIENKQENEPQKLGRNQRDYASSHGKQNASATSLGMNAQFAAMGPL